MVKIINNSTNNIVIFSVVGGHAGETMEEIFQRKIDNIIKTGSTFWMFRSYKIDPIVINNILENNIITVYFIKSSNKKTNTNTKKSDNAKFFSYDKKEWFKIPAKLMPVTGKIDNSAKALLLREIFLVSEQINLSDYSDFDNIENECLLRHGASTILSKLNIKKNNKIPKIRDVVAVGKLSFDKGVCWLNNENLDKSNKIIEQNPKV